MALTIDSKVKELMKNPKTADLLAQDTPGFKTNLQMKLVGALTFRKLAAFPRVSPEKLAEIGEALKALGE